MNAATRAAYDPSPDFPPRLLRRAEVLARTGLSLTTHAELVKRGLFPAPVQLTARIFTWREDEVRAWISERIAVRDEHRERDDPLINADLSRSA